jgi:TRAP-type uncharacterized transport system substrate-binding protein
MQGRKRPVQFDFGIMARCLLGAFLLIAAALWSMTASSFAENAPPLTVAPGFMPQADNATKPMTRAAKRKAHAEMVERINANTVSIVSGTPGATYFRIASDIAFALDDGDNLRILPILGKGAEQNAYDILFLKGVDIGLVRTDTLDLLKRDARLDGPEAQLVYLARLFNDEMHVVTGTDVTDISQLAGKKVNFDVRGSGSNFTGRRVFELLGINVEGLNLDQPTALQMLKRGEIAAVVSVAAKPVATLANFVADGRFHFVEVPYNEKVAEFYFPASYANTDYPNLVEKGAIVNSVAVGTILGAYNWSPGSDRYGRLAHFTEALFSKFSRLQTPARHPKWQEVNLNATVPGWTRFKPAQDWLNKNGAGSASAEQLTNFKQFVESRAGGGLSSSDQEKLFKEFLEWSRTQSKKPQE